MTDYQEDNYVSFWDRLLAHNIDLLFMIIPLFLVSGLFANNTLFYALCALVYLIYNVGFEVSTWKATPGKRIMKIMVITPAPEAFFRLTLRNMLKLISLLTVFIGFAMITYNQKKQGLHDYLTGCVMVYRD